MEKIIARLYIYPALHPPEYCSDAPLMWGFCLLCLSHLHISTQKDTEELAVPIESLLMRKSGAQNKKALAAIHAGCWYFYKLY